ncbi:MAG TPA: FGGY-family carbohydrate kinase [Magnetospirillaceae bacterium]
MIVAHASRPYPMSRPAPGIVEQDPNDWVTRIVAIMDELLTGDRARRVAAVGLCSQVNTDIFVDAEGQSVAPAITWQDNRAASQAAELDLSISMDEKLAWWGAPMPVGASHVLARMLWMAREKPALYAKTRYVLTPKDYCLRALAGVAVTDPMSNFFVVGQDLAYVAPLIARVAGAAERFPPLHFFTDVVGEIALGSSGLRAPVVAGTMDAWSGLFGAGVHRAGEGVYISGTSEIIALAGERVGAPGVVTFPNAAGLSVHAGPTQSGGDALRWWGEAIGRDVAGVIELAGKADRSGRPILFLPHLEGERAPLWDANLRGAFIGLDGQAKAPDFALAVMEGVALSARMLLGALEDAAGGPLPRLFHAGGGAHSDLWAQIRADSLGRPLDRMAYLDVGCLGAAIMASVGVGAHESLGDAIRSMTRVERSFEPDIRMKPRYDALYETYIKATERLKPVGIIGR